MFADIVIQLGYFEAKTACYVTNITSDAIFFQVQYPHQILEQCPTTSACHVTPAPMCCRLLPLMSICPQKIVVFYLN